MRVRDLLNVAMRITTVSLAAENDVRQRFAEQVMSVVFQPTMQIIQMSAVTNAERCLSVASNALQEVLGEKHMLPKLVRFCLHRKFVSRKSYLVNETLTKLLRRLLNMKLIVVNRFSLLK